MAKDAPESDTTVETPEATATVTAPRKLSDYHEPTMLPDLPAEFDGQDVVVIAAKVVSKIGKRGDYALTIVKIADDGPEPDSGEQYSITGNAVATAFADVPKDAYPISCTFESHPSMYDDSKVWWTVR